MKIINIKEQYDELMKLPIIECYHDLICRRDYDSNGGYVINVVSGNVGKIWASDLYSVEYEKFTFDYDVIAKSRDGGFYFLVKSNWFIKYKFYFISWLKNINRRILWTFDIWGLMDREIGRYPTWRDLKMFKRSF